MGTARRRDRERIRGLAGLAKVLSCPVRLEVLVELGRGPARVCELAGRMELDATLISHHLRELRGAGLVEADQAVGRSVYRLTSSTDVLAQRERLQVGAAVGRLGIELSNGAEPDPGGDPTGAAASRNGSPRSA